MVIQTTNPFAPAKPRVPLIPRRLQPVPDPVEVAKQNKTHCPKCSSLLRVNYQDAECLNCGFVDYDYVAPEQEKKGNTLIGTGTRYVIRYIGEFDALSDVVTHVKVYRVRNRVMYGVSCPFCGSGMAQSSLSGKRREIREERYKCNSGHRVSLCPNGKGDIGWK